MTEKNYLISNYRSAYGVGYEFKSILLLSKQVMARYMQLIGKKILVETNHLQEWTESSLIMNWLAIDNEEQWLKFRKEREKYNYSFDEGSGNTPPQPYPFYVVWVESESNGYPDTFWSTLNKSECEQMAKRLENAE